MSDAKFVDSHLTYDGAATKTLYGAWHLEGETLYGLADGEPTGPLVVQNGAVTLPRDATTAVLGLGIDSYIETNRPELPTPTGTSQGKVKRPNAVVIRLWDTLGGEIGQPGELVSLKTRKGDAKIGDMPPLFSGDLPVITIGGKYNTDGIIAFRQPADKPLPFNVIAIMPDYETAQSAT